jgi:hypothetical protein
MAIFIYQQNKDDAYLYKPTEDGQGLLCMLDRFSVKAYSSQVCTIIVKDLWYIILYNAVLLPFK